MDVLKQNKIESNATYVKNVYHTQEATVADLSEDRRSKRRYPITLPVQYKIMKNYLVMGSGSGTTVDLSSGGIAFSTPEPGRLGSFLEVSVSWACTAQSILPPEAVASGRVIRSDQD